MSAEGQHPSLEQTNATVPTLEGKQLTVQSGHPWPSAYRGSVYSLISSRKFGDVAQWSHMGVIQAMTELPRGLKSALEGIGKTEGYGSFRITASGEILSKVPASQYDKAHQAKTSRGHVPVYVGRLTGHFDFDEISNDPPVPDAPTVWTGLPFGHGETWAVCSDDVLRWSWQDYYFESAFDHPDLVAAYQSLRPRGGLLYINEHGHVWGNVDRDSVPPAQRDRVRAAFRAWQEDASNAERRLVNRRLNRTESEAVPDGLLPIHLGHVTQFDDGLVPKPVVDDNRYFGDTATQTDG